MFNDAPTNMSMLESSGLRVEQVKSDGEDVVMHDDVRMDFVFALVRAAGDLATYCDRTEHNEDTRRATIVEISNDLRLLAVRSSQKYSLDIQSLYSSRLERVEAKHPAWTPCAFDGAQRIREAKSWADLQSAQYSHDLYYHADVAGLAKFDQLRHYTLHLTKLAKLALDAAQGPSDDTWDAFLTERLPDVAIFGIKLATVCGNKLPLDGIASPA